MVRKNPEQLREWLSTAKKRNATHVIVAYNHNTRKMQPITVGRNQSVQTKLSSLNADFAFSPKEVYDLSEDIDKQILQARTWNV